MSKRRVSSLEDKYAKQQQKQQRLEQGEESKLVEVTFKPGKTKYTSLIEALSPEELSNIRNNVSMSNFGIALNRRSYSLPNVDNSNLNTTSSNSLGEELEDNGSNDIPSLEPVNQSAISADLAVAMFAQGYIETCSVVI